MNQQEMNQYWKNQQFNRIEKIKRSDENWLKKEIIPHFEQTVRKIYDYLDYYTSRMSESGEISVSKSREVPSKEDIDRYLEMLYNLDIQNEEYNEAILSLKHSVDKGKKFTTNVELLEKYIITTLVYLGDIIESLLSDRIDNAITTEIEIISNHPMVKKNSIPDTKKLGINGVTNHGANYKHRIWRDYRKTSRDIFNHVEASILNGKPLEEWSRKLKDNIKGSVDKFKRSFKKLAISEIGTAMILSTYTILKNHSDVEKVQVVCEATACPKCSQFDGTIISLHDVIFGDNAPKWHPNCRCILVPYV